jgi:hypothetical protein
MQAYDVAIWVRWPVLCPEYVEVVEAPGPLAAVALVMLGYDLEQVARVAVRLLSGGPVKRHWSVKLTAQGLEVGSAVDMGWKP